MSYTKREVEDLMAENWRLFRRHKPAGAYLPIGQLDGDCGECGHEWPCETIRDIFK